MGSCIVQRAWQRVEVEPKHSSKPRCEIELRRSSDGLKEFPHLCYQSETTSMHFQGLLTSTGDAQSAVDAYDRQAASCRNTNRLIVLMENGPQIFEESLESDILVNKKVQLPPSILVKDSSAN